MYREPEYEHNIVDLWVSEDGSYGSGLINFFDTTDWTNKDFDSLDRAPDSEKLETAMDIAHRISKRITKESLKRLDVRVFIIDNDGVEEIK
jgi:hypothetical protein